MLIGYLGLRVALRCRSNQSRLVAIGCAALLVGQSVMNVAVASGAMPTTGLPLPLVSYGGNSLLSSLMIVGLLIRCSLESTGLIGERGHAQRPVSDRRRQRPDR
jgi:cell division protein FtsW